MNRSVSLSELAAAGIHLRPAEAAAVVAELCRQHAGEESPGIPSPGIIRITNDGSVVAQGPIPREDAGVARAGHLLNDLIPDADAPAAYRAGGGLRLVIARALGILDLPPYSGLDELRAALVRFAGPDPVATIRGLFERWEHAVVPSGPQPVTALVELSPPGMVGGPAFGRSRSLSSKLGLGVAALLMLGTIGFVVGSAQLDRPARAEAPAANRLTPEPPAEPERTASVRKVRRVAASAPGTSASAARPSTTRPSTRLTPQPRRETALARRRQTASEPRRAAALERRRGPVAQPRHAPRDTALEPGRDVAPEPNRNVAPEPREVAPEPRREAALEPRREAAPEPRNEAPPRRSFLDRQLLRIVIK